MVAIVERHLIATMNTTTLLQSIRVSIAGCMALLLMGIKPYAADPYPQINTVDRNATPETKALYANLKSLSQDQLLFGHQDALAYGVKWDDWHKRRSDVKDVCGKHPAVFGWDMSKLGKYAHNIDSVNFRHMRAWMKQAYKIGGINTVSWHFDNFTTGGDSWDTGERVVADILPGGKHHADYVHKLDLFAGFIRKLKVGFLSKKAIPIVFRPFHEHTGSWFWWGKDHCTAEEYKQLWRFTVTYLRDEQQLHNLLYAYSPDIFQDEAHYLERYPGDEYVDILGLDDYHDVGASGHIEDLVKRLRMLVQLAESRDKVAALTETGFEAIPDETWWTEKLLTPIKNDSLASRIAWVLCWRNDRLDHHYAPYPGHQSAENFRKFSQDPFVLFGEDVPNLYRLK